MSIYEIATLGPYGFPIYMGEGALDGGPRFYGGRLGKLLEPCFLFLFPIFRIGEGTARLALI